MNTEFKYKLASKGKTICPKCHKKRFVLYTDTETIEPLHSTVGRCDRADSCAHHYTPKQYFADKGMNAPRYIFTKGEVILT